jgi:serine/threonine protein kinase
MSDRDGGLSLLSATLIEHVDVICDRFGRAWKEGERPRIEDFLAAEAEPGRSVLLHELLVTELGCRLQRAEHPDRREYRARFPDHRTLVDAAFARFADDGGGAALEPGSLRTSDLGPDAIPGRLTDAPAVGSLGPSARADQRYRVLSQHAEGGLGVVYRARDEELHREVALKEIHPRVAARPESRADFLREAEINGGLEHPGIVPVYSLGRHPDGRPYYAMRFIEGTSLKGAIDTFHRDTTSGLDPGDQSLAVRKLLDRFRAVCEVLAYAHSRGVVHRDVKPHNIMLGPFGETLLVDWGLARTIPPTEPAPGTESRPLHLVAPEGSGETAGMVVGTPAYMSPEQAEGRSDRLGPPSDIYGLGATLYHLLTGRPAFEGGTRAVLVKVSRGEFPSPRSLQPKIPRALEAICLKAMALRSEDRYATARALAEDIERWQADQPVSAWREPVSIRAWRWVKRHRTPVIAVVAAVLLTTVVFGGCVLLYCLKHLHIPLTHGPHGS